MFIHGGQDITCPEFDPELETQQGEPTELVYSVNPEQPL